MQCVMSVEAALLDADVCVFVLRGSLLPRAYAPRARKNALRTSQRSLAGGFSFEVKIHAHEHICLLVCNVQAHASTRARSDWHPCCWAQRKVQVMRRSILLPCHVLSTHQHRQLRIRPRALQFLALDPNFSTCRCIPFDCAISTVPCTHLHHLHLLLLLHHRHRLLLLLHHQHCHMYHLRTYHLHTYHHLHLVALTCVRVGRLHVALAHRCNDAASVPSPPSTSHSTTKTACRKAEGRKDRNHTRTCETKHEDVWRRPQVRG